MSTTWSRPTIPLSALALSVFCVFSCVVNQATAAPLVGYSLRAVSSDGSPLEFAQVGQELRLEVFVEDLRSPAAGVYSAFADVAYSASQASVLDSVTIGQSFPNGHVDASTSLGLLNEFGGVSPFDAPAVGKSLLFSALLKVLAPGELRFELNPSDLIHHETSLLGRDTRLRQSEISYGSLSIMIVPEPNAILPLLFSTGMALVVMKRRASLSA